MLGLLGIPTEVWAGVFTSVLSFFAEKSARSAAAKDRLIEIAIKAIKGEDDSADKAVKRFPVWVRSSIALFLTIGLTGAIIALAWNVDIPVTLVSEVPKKSFLGLFSWGKTVELTEINGLAMIPMLTHGFFAIIGAVFGRLAGRAGR